MINAVTRAVILQLCVSSVWGQDLMRYNFDEGGAATQTANSASSPVGNQVAPLYPGALVDGKGCRLGASALVGNGTGRLDTGWSAALPPGTSWYLGFFMDMTATSNAPFSYTSGDFGAGQWRTYVNGAAGAGNALMRGGGITPCMIPGGAALGQPRHVLWVYDHSGHVIRGYLDGECVVTQPQVGSIVISSVNSSFIIGGFGSSSFSLAASACMDQFILGTGDPFSSGVMEMELGLCAEYQVNQPGRCSLDADGVQGGPLFFAMPSACAGVGGVINSDGMSGLPWDIGLGSASPISVSGGGIRLSDGQIVNLDFTDPALSFINGISFTSPYPGPFSLPYNLPTAGVSITGQQVNLDPSAPIGIGLSQPNQLDVVDRTVFSSVLGDDNFIQIASTTCGGPGPGGWAFGGVAYPTIFANSNGSVSASSGISDFSATVAEFLSQDARLAGFWTDLSPNVAGSTTVTVFGGVAQYDIQGVPEFGAPTTLNSVTMIVDSNTDTLTITSYAPDPTHATDSLIGFSPGGGATDPGSVSFLALMGFGPQANFASDAIYEFAAGAAIPGGFTDIQFMGGSALWIVN